MAGFGGPFLRLNLEEIEDRFGADSRLGGIRDFWKALPRAGAAPARADCGMDALRPWLGWVSLIDAAPETEGYRFRWRLIGSRITAVLGRDVTGRHFDDLYEGQILADYTRLFSLSLARNAPVFLAGDVEYLDKKHVLFDSVHLPLVDKGPAPDMILLCASMRTALEEHAFDRY